jgi:hypothetical protein
MSSSFSDTLDSDSGVSMSFLSIPLRPDYLPQHYGRGNVSQYRDRVATKV